MQIGPRIRIGGTVGQIGQKVKLGAGKVLSNPIVDGVAGAFLGPAAAAGLGGLGRALDTSGGSVGVGDIAGGALRGGVAGYAGSKLGGILKGGIGGIANSVGGASSAAGDVDMGGSAAGEAGGASGGSGWWDKAKGLLLGGGNDGQGNLGVLGDWLGKANAATGGGSGLDKGLLIAAIADAAATKKRQTDLQNKGLEYATDAYSAKQPLRHRGLELMQDETAPDLSSIFVNPKNPYNKTVPVPQVGTRVPLGAPVVPTSGTY